MQLAHCKKQCFIRPAVLIIIAALGTGCSKSGPQAGEVAMASTAQDSSTSPLLRKWCSDCHAPPKPTAHKASEWPSVVAQMQMHRTVNGFSKINDQDLETLLKYLEDHARP